MDKSIPYGVKLCFAYNLVGEDAPVLPKRMSYEERTFQTAENNNPCHLNRSASAAERSLHFSRDDSKLGLYVLQNILHSATFCGHPGTGVPTNGGLGFTSTEILRRPRCFGLHAIARLNTQTNKKPPLCKRRGTASAVEELCHKPRTFKKVTYRTNNSSVTS